MKKHLLIFVLLLFISCKKSIVGFSVAQPENTKDLSSFPEKLIGTYYDTENNLVLEIGKYLIIKKTILKDTMNVKELSRFEILKNDSIVNTKTFDKFLIKRINDSFLTNYVYTDTVFNIGKDKVLRKMNGYYFLNSKDEDNIWSVKKIILKNGQLNINEISTNKEIELLEEITETKNDTSQLYVVKPTKKQFKQFVNENGFNKGEIYLKK